MTRSFKSVVLCIIVSNALSLITSGVGSDLDHSFSPDISSRFVSEAFYHICPPTTDSVIQKLRACQASPQPKIFAEVFDSYRSSEALLWVEGCTCILIAPLTLWNLPTYEACTCH